MFMKYWKLKVLCTLFKIEKQRHCEGKSLSGRLQSPAAQDIEFCVNHSPQLPVWLKVAQQVSQSTCPSQSVSLVNRPKRVSWGLPSICPKTRLPVSLVFQESLPWPHVEHSRSSKPLGFVYCRAHLERVCQVAHNPSESKDSRWMYRWTWTWTGLLSFPV